MCEGCPGPALSVTRRSLLAGLGAFILPTATATATAPDLQPHASCWYPEDLLHWRPERDSDLPFNRSTVPLAPRFAPPPVNRTARSGQARVSALVSFAPTSGNPSQGSGTADFYALSHWAYLDELVFWGGSSGEGLILAPNAPVIDAAHRNGVPVLGTVFLPPVAYGGKLQWTRDLVQRDARGGFPVADRLIRVARTYGFDGWFLNAETGGGDARLGADMRDFVAHLHAHGRGLRVTWYDAMVASGDVDWQNRLDDSNAAFFDAAGTMFVNFGWNKGGLLSSARRATTMRRSPYELWAGVDVEANGWDTHVDWDAVVPSDRPHVASFGFYRPEWTWKSLPSGRRSPADFHARDDRFWSGASLDPSRPAAGPWRPPAASVADRSAVTALPFATTFNTGHGLGWYERGRRNSDAPWNHLGLQDRLPGRRWVVRTDGARPDVVFDFADAWHGGSSLLVAGPLTGPATVGLYDVRLPVSAATVVELTHRSAEAVHVELAVTADRQTCFLSAGTLHGPGWRTTVLSLGALAGRTLDALGIRLTVPGRGGTVRWRLGRLAVRDAVAPAPARPRALHVIAARPDGSTAAALRLAWQAAPGPVRHYELRQALPGGGFRFLGGTCGHAYYVPALRRTAGEAATRIEVRAVDELYAASVPAHVTHRWPTSR
ncbi:endo-beta-N-acetylglucosaminidase [Streptomyces morookaense]|uniref:endo-beta-N-acetylglucosaminidase n=1 Tax=Streptomyces morookaense TaxID=1970 RepID=UPI0033DEBF58